MSNRYAPTSFICCFLLWLSLSLPVMQWLVVFEKKPPCGMPNTVLLLVQLFSSVDTSSAIFYNPAGSGACRRQW